MNKKGNQRYAETKEKIQTTFLELLKDRELQNISVSEICKRSGIHRTTFYGHYEDVYDLMDQMLGEMYFRLMDNFKMPEWKNFVGVFALVRDNQSFFTYYLQHEGSRKGVEHRLPELMQERINEIMKTMGYHSEEELYYHQTFFRGGLMAIMRKWLAGGCRETPEEMDQIIRDEYLSYGRLH